MGKEKKSLFAMKGKVAFVLRKNTASGKPSPFTSSPVSCLLWQGFLNNKRGGKTSMKLHWKKGR